VARRINLEDEDGAMNDPQEPHESRQMPSISFEEHLERLFAYAVRLTGSHDLAEDLTQQAFLVAQQRIGQLRDPNKLAAWLLRIVRNLFLKHCRRRHPLPVSQVDLDLEEVLHDDAMELPCDEERIQLALAQLPLDYRAVVLMFYFEELSYREIATELEIPEGTVMSRLARARNHLRRLLVAPQRLST
jgi:RNA polymerase sigma-70 factor (ECF subfamily)